MGPVRLVCCGYPSGCAARTDSDAVFGTRASTSPAPKVSTTHAQNWWWFIDRYEIFSCGCFPFDTIENDDFGPLLISGTKPMHKHLEFDEASSDRGTGVNNGSG